VLQTIVPTYLCPTDLNTNRLEQPASGSLVNTPIAPSSYKAMAGASPVGFSPETTRDGYYFDLTFLAMQPEPPPQSVYDATLTIPQPSSWRGLLHVVHELPIPGVVRQFRPERHAAIRDGTSNTLAVTEYHTRTNNRNRAFWGYGRNQYSHAAAMITSVTRTPDFDECVRLTNGDPGIQCRRTFASLHPGGANAVFADGSVRFLSQNLDGRLFMALATIAGEEVLPNF
jgi:prepilin-type processing-associated H-X9-DG protein